MYVCAFLCVGMGVYIMCINSHCLIGNHVYSSILYLRLFVEMYANLFLVKLFIKHNEFSSC